MDNIFQAFHLLHDLTSKHHISAQLTIKHAHCIHANVNERIKMSVLWCFDHQFLHGQYLAPEMKYRTDRYRISNVQRVSTRWGAATCSNFKATSLWHRFPCQPAKGLPAVALDPPVHVASCKQSKQNVLEVKYPSHTPVPLPIGYKSHQNQSFASPNLHSLGSLMAWRGDKSTSFGSRATKVLTSALKAETTSKPRSAELAAVASSSCSKQNSFTLSVVRAESMRKQFTSFQIHFYRPPCLQNSAPNPKKKVLSVLMKGTLAEMMSNCWTFWISVLRMTSGDCKKTKVLLRKACDWIPVNSKDIRRPAHLPWKTMENCAWSVWIHWSCYGAVAPGLSISSACWIMLQQLHLWSLYTCHMYVYICFNLL